MNLLREYIREWVRANDKLLMLDKQGIYLEKEDREEISKFLKSMGLLESKTCGLQPPQTPIKPRTASVLPVDTYRFPNLPYPSVESPEGRKDLDMVIHQYNNRVVPEELQDAADNDMDGLFESYLDSRGLTYNTSYYKSLRLDLIPLIKLLKKHYNRLRPNQTATLLGIEFPGDTLKSAQTPSYPSGHTVQAFVLALKFSEQFPDHVDNLLSIAELISQSRIDRGVHFPSDIEFGRLIAYLIVEEMKDGTTP